MWTSTMTTKSDPLAAFTAGAFTPDRKPVPLVSTRFDVEIIGGLAVVETVRIFRNDEPVTIEATITFPVPVHAALYRLQASVDGRRLIATAKARKAAREEYEDAVERGKAAVLHEEVLKGVHTLSVAHIAPGTEIEIATTWVASLSLVGAEARLRVPLTVGDIYGRSGLNEADDLITGGASSMARLTIRSDAGEARVAGVTLVNGEAEVPLNAPIDLVIADWSPIETTGVAADGRAVRLSVQPAATGEDGLGVAILVDHSGSMAAAADMVAERRQSAHEVAVEALSTYPCRSGDAFDLWQFDDTSSRVGEITVGQASSSALRDLAAQLDEPCGGTEIGGALENVLAHSKARDILLITDGQSYALDVHRLASRGRRISVILVGEGSLDAKVGHLAALTGGDVWVAAGSDIGSVMRSGLDSLRVRATPAVRTSGPGASEGMSLNRCGLRIEATWGKTLSGADAIGHPAVAPFLAGLLLPTLAEEEAAALAAAEGLVTHLTSLVLVDEASEVQEDIPLLRKVSLPSPRTQSGVTYCKVSAPMHSASMKSASMDPGIMASSSLDGFVADHSSSSRSSEIWGSFDPPRRPARAEAPEITDLRAIADYIDWGTIGNDLAKGDLSGLEDWVQRHIERKCELPGLQQLADALGIEAMSLMIATIAHLATGDRHAQRVANRLATVEQIEEVVRLLSGQGPELAGSGSAVSGARPTDLD